MKLPGVSAWLATMAAGEAASRERHYPAMVERGEIERGDAETDLAAWRAIADLFTHGKAETGLSWAQLEHAAARAVVNRHQALEALDAAPLRKDETGDDRLRRRVWLVERLHAVQALHARLEIQRELFAPAARAGEEARAA